MALSPAQTDVLLALGAGWTLKSHRSLDGQKGYRLHALSGDAERVVTWQTVEGLREQALIDSNKKFPAATYLLTERGKEIVDRLRREQGHEENGEGPLTASGWR